MCSRRGPQPGIGYVLDGLRALRCAGSRKSSFNYYGVVGGTFLVRGFPVARLLGTCLSDDTDPTRIYGLAYTAYTKRQSEMESTVNLSALYSCQDFTCGHITQHYTI